MTVSSGHEKYLHMIGHGHIDPTWLWHWEEGFEEVRATFRSAVEQMKEYDDFTFTASSACFYQWVKDTDPKLFESIRTFVAEGRWEIVGGFWVEPDCNLPCGESFVRHGLYSQRFFEREFGKRCSVGFNPDSFGHAGTLPQILRKLGMAYYVYMRPEPDCEMDYPNGIVFRWRAPDGSEVLAAQIPLGYGASGTEIHEKMKRLLNHPHVLPTQRHILCFYGVGNHGGGPTREAIDTIKEAQKCSAETGVIPLFSTLESFFAAFQSDIQADAIGCITTDLQHHARGCYSVLSEIKRMNRRVEHALMNAERFAVAAWLMGSLSYPHDALEKCWKDLLYNQFHDILAGTSLESAYEDARDQLGAARHRADVILNRAIQSIARDIDTSAEGNALIAFNPLPWPVSAALTAPPIAARRIDSSVHIVDESESPIPCQPIRGDRIDHTRYQFVAQVPAMGYRVFYMRGGSVYLHQTLPLHAGPTFLENAWWRIEFDPTTGEMTRLVDLGRKVEVLRRGHVLSVLADHSDTWSHGVDEYRVEVGRFANAQIQIVECGDVQATLRIVNHYDKSTVISEYMIFREINHIACNLRINWQQYYHMLKLGFDTHICGGTATYEVPYGCQERATDGGEEPMQQWVDLTGIIENKPYGLAITNDSKYGADIRNGMMRISLLRSPAYAHHDNGRFESSAWWPIIDQGWQRVKLELIPHPGDWRQARVVKRAWELNAPPFIHPESKHTGNFALQAGLLGTESENVLISVIKCSEDGEAIIVRGYETAGMPTETRLHFPYFQKSFDIAFAPYEIKTIRISSSDWSMREVNLLEE